MKMFEPFDPEHAVATYRKTIAARDEQTAEPGWIEFNAIVQRLRREWKEWQGEDSLHEMAFGEPQDETQESP
jgi:hypothetical protein